MKRPARGLLWLFGLLSVLAVTASSPAGPAGSEETQGLTVAELEDGVRAWRRTGKTPEGFPVDLAGFNFLWQASPGDGSRVAAISKVHGGYLALFGEAGDLLDLLETGEIYYSVLLCDLDQDAVAEVITDEVKGFGTGYFDRDFHVYKSSSDSLIELGTRTSYRSRMVYKPDGDPSPEIIRGYVRCDPGDGMQPKGLAYVVEQTDEGRSARVIGRSQLQVEGGRLTDLPEREELPNREDTLPGGKVRELAREEMEEALQLCRAAPSRFVEAEVELDPEGEVQSLELRTGSGEQACDRAVSRALKASSWVSCHDLREPAPCRVSYALSLGSPLHQR